MIEQNGLSVLKKGVFALRMAEESTVYVSSLQPCPSAQDVYRNL